MAKVGRPKVKEEKAVNISFHCSKADADAIRSKAARDGRSVADWVRRAVQNAE